MPAVCRAMCPNKWAKALPDPVARSQGAVPPFVRSGLLEDVAHGFFGRQGGVSGDVFSSLNCGPGSGDKPDAVAENRRRVTDAVLPGAYLTTLYQIHSAQVVRVNAAIGHDDRPEADAMVTDRPGLLLGILTADCAPVLFADSVAGVVAAAHSGWKGALNGINEATIAAMESLGAQRSRIACVIGPCIAQKSYEVDEGFFKRFSEVDPAHERFFREGRAGHFQFDLEAFVAGRLAAAGIERIECLGLDTYPASDRYFSYRRTCHAGESDYGRQISIIGLPPTCRS